MGWGMKKQMASGTSGKIGKVFSHVAHLSEGNAWFLLMCVCNLGKFSPNLMSGFYEKLMDLRITVNIDTIEAACLLVL